MEIFWYILVASVATALTRFLPFLIFKKSLNNKNLLYLQKNSGIIIMTILLVYAITTLEADLKVTILAVFCSIFAIILQAWRRNFLLSIALSTIVYMAILRLL